MQFPTVLKDELYAISFDQSYNLYTNNAMYNQIEWFWMSIKKLQKGDIFLLGGNFVIPDWKTGRLITEIKAAIARGARVILLITRFYAGGYNADGICYRDCDDGYTPGTKDDTKKWGCLQFPSQHTSDTLYAWACYASNLIGQLPGVNVVDVPNIDPSSNIYSHVKLITFLYTSDNTCSIFHGSANLDTNPDGHYQNELGFGYMCGLDEPFAQYNIVRDIYIFNNYLDYYKDDSGKSLVTGVAEAVGLLKPLLKSSTPPALPLKIKSFRFCAPRVCFNQDDTKTYKCGVQDKPQPFYCKGNSNEDWVYGVDTDVTIMPGLSPGVNTSLPDWAKYYNNYFPDHVDLLVDLIKEGSYFKSCILSQGLEQGDQDNVWSLPQRISAGIKDFLKAGKKWFQINATPSVSDGIGSGSFLHDVDIDPNDLKNLFFRNFNPPIQSIQAKEKTHEKLYINDKSVMYSSGHPQNMHLQGPIVNECIVFHNAPNFHAYVETFFNYEWIFGTKAYPGYAPDSAADSFIYCGVPEFQKGDGKCCIGNETRIIQNYNVSSLNNLDLCTGVTCPEGQTCDKTTGKCGGGSDPCAGVTCPPGQTCDKATGKCVGGGDPCAGVTCPAGQTCDKATGKCVGGGSCGGVCRDDQICNKTTNKCEDNLCYGVNCPGNSKCSKETGLCSDGKKKHNYIFLYLLIFTAVLIIVLGGLSRFKKISRGMLAFGLISLGVLFIVFSAFALVDFLKKSNAEPSNDDMCTFVTCPPGKTCDKATGKCVGGGDPCAGVTCPPGKTCDKATGKCVGGGKCAGVTCPPGKTCDATTGLCVDSGDKCASVTCPAEQSCDPASGQCVAKDNFYEVKGLSGGGYCYGTRNSYPFNKNIPGTTLDDCKQKCKDDNSCNSISFSTAKGCTMFSLDNKDPSYANASAGWNPKNTYFPAYASPYYDCPDPIPKRADGCLYQYPDSCKAGEPGTSCWKKNPTLKSGYDVKIGSPDGSKAQIVLSNPYIRYDTLTTPNTFYWWFLDLLNSATKFIILCNTYITLGKYISDDSSDAQSAIAMAYVNAAKRGVQIQFVVTYGDQNAVCATAMVAEINKYTSENNKAAISTIGFFHDKVYISDKKAYIGGQNASGPSSIDFGISFSSDSPLYADILSRANNINTKFYTDLIFKYNADTPFVDQAGTKYFIAVSPTTPSCPTVPGNMFPQAECPNLQKNATGYYMKLLYDSDAKKWYYGTGTTIVSYERSHLLNVIRNSTKFLTITNYEWSFFGDMISNTGYDSEFEASILDAAQRGVAIKIWMNNQLIQQESKYYNQTTCNLLRCNEGNDWIKKLAAYENVKISWWYNPDKNSKDGYACATLHAKIYYSDWGVLISSSNYTPVYYSNTADTGLCAIFSGNPPDWISTGIQNAIDLLSSNKTCNNTVANFDGLNGCASCASLNCNPVCKKSA